MVLPKPRRAGELAELLDTNAPLMSKHLKTLRETGRDNLPSGARIRVVVRSGSRGAQVVRVIEVDTTSAVERPARADVDRRADAARGHRGAAGLEDLQRADAFRSDVGEVERAAGAARVVGVLVAASWRDELFSLKEIR